jgi:hypothetical protein
MTQNKLKGHWNLLNPSTRCAVTCCAINKSWKKYWTIKQKSLCKLGIIEKSMNKKKDTNWWMGIEGIEMIWHGTQADPELVYKGISKNYWEIENTIYQECKEDFGKVNAENDDFFQIYCKDHADDIKTLFTGYE